MSSEQPRGMRHALTWGILYSVLLISLVTPLMVLTFWFLSIPAVILYVKTNRVLFWGTITASVLIGAGFAGGAAAQILMLALFSLIPAIVIGNSYRRLHSARVVLTRGTVAFISMFLAVLVIAASLGFELNPSIDATVRESIEILPEAVRQTLAAEEIRSLVQLTQMLVPLYIFGTSFFMAAVTHAIGRRVLNRLGETLAGLKPIRQWRLPRAFVWYYLIVLFVDLLTPVKNDSFFSTVIMNVVPIFMFVFAVQGIAFLFFIADAKRWGRWIPWLRIALILLVPYLFFSAFSLLGVIDTAFPLRERMRKH
ncbi:DUF2232 domain-containing protein [Paenibacillus alkalitolerans]|uniref:DUF2232 domain-containing protein n=1 Tax=Paenibacillus alkalitolerans TaxID=2799335 RepID=UPI0018F4F150|nr:DUF2232 domain-containing protein [Paenibacillus alkalitolerans]